MTKLTRTDWINAATEVLSTGGIDLVRVDNLAKQLKITRGSFYYHFENRQELLVAILERWRIKATETVIMNLQKRYQSPKAQLTELMQLPFRGERSKKAASIEISLRAWARRDPMARAAVEEVDSYRVSHIEKLFLEMGHSPNQAADLSHLVYGFMVSKSLLLSGVSNTEQVERAQRLANFLSTNCPHTECTSRQHFEHSF